MAVGGFCDRKTFLAKDKLHVELRRWYGLWLKLLNSADSAPQYSVDQLYTIGCHR